MDAIEAAVILTTKWMERVPLTNVATINEQAACKAYGMFYKTVVSLKAEHRKGKLETLPFEWEEDYPQIKKRLQG